MHPQRRGAAVDVTLHRIFFKSFTTGELGKYRMHPSLTLALNARTCENEALLHGWDALLLLYSLFDALDCVRGLDVNFDLLSCSPFESTIFLYTLNNCQRGILQIPAESILKDSDPCIKGEKNA